MWICTSGAGERVTRRTEVVVVHDVAHVHGMEVEGVAGRLGQEVHCARHLLHQHKPCAALRVLEHDALAQCAQQTAAQSSLQDFQVRVNAFDTRGLRNRARQMVQYDMTGMAD